MSESPDLADRPRNTDWEDIDHAPNLHDSNSLCYDCTEAWPCEHHNSISRLRAQSESYRAALRKIRDGGGRGLSLRDCCDIARAALDQETENQADRPRVSPDRFHRLWRGPQPVDQETET